MISMQGKSSKRQAKGRGPLSIRRLFLSYLASGHKGQGTESRAHIGDVGLQVVEGIGNLSLDLIGLLPRRAVGRNLVKSLGGHDG